MISNVTVPFVIQNCFFSTDFETNMTGDYDTSIFVYNVSYCGISSNTCIDKRDAAIFFDKSHGYAIGNTILRNRIGIGFWNSSLDVISNEILESDSRSILMVDCSDCNVSSNQLSASHNDTILVQESEDCTFFGNNISGRLSFWGCDNCSISDNEIVGGSDDGIYLMMSNKIMIFSNDIAISHGTALDVSHSTNCRFEHNQISPPMIVPVLLLLEDSNGCAIEQNSLSGCQISYISTKYCAITQNYLDVSRIVLEDALFTQVDHNRLSNAPLDAIVVNLSVQTTVSYNSILSASQNGIRVLDSTSCYCSGNYITNCDNGIHIENVDSSRFTFNYVYNQNSYGISIVSGSDNRLYGNRLTEQGDGPAGDWGSDNQWDDGDIIGNFWEGIDYGILNIHGTALSQDRCARPNSGTPSSFPEIHYEPLFRIFDSYTAQIVWIVWSGPFQFAFYMNGSTSGFHYHEGSGRLNLQFPPLPGRQYTFELEIDPLDMIIYPPLRSPPFVLVIAEADADSDLMPDSWEHDHGLDPRVDDSGGDADSDDLSNLDEYLLGTDPRNPDSDSDSIFDGWEVTYGCNPLDASDASLDLDSDSLTNLQEFELGTDPTNSDSDSDSYPDAWEVQFGFDPNNPVIPLSEYFTFHSPTISSICGGVIAIVGILVFKHKQKIMQQKKLVEEDEEEEQRALRDLFC